jgi:hypothetical protein
MENKKKYEIRNQPVSNNFGKEGILNLSDVFTRKLEFHSWLTEVKNKSLDYLTPENERNYIEEFIYNFNNALFPSKKYYDIIKYKARAVDRMLRKRKRDKDRLNSNKRMNEYAGDEGEFVFDDEGQKEKEKKILKELEQKKKLEDAISTMNKKKAEAMKEIDFKGNLMRHLYQTGDVAGAKALHQQYFETKKEKDKSDNGPNIEDIDRENMD